MRKRFFRGLLPLALVFTLLSCSSEDTLENPTIATPPQVQNYAYSSPELALENAINDYRSSIGLKPLQADAYISCKAQTHNAYMIANHVVNHDYFEARSEEIITVLGAVKVTENVAYNYTSAHAVLDAWLQSPGHKANIEGDFTHIGISILLNAETRKNYYTNIFVKK